MQKPRFPPPEVLMTRFQGRLDANAFEQIVSSYMSPALAVARQLLADNTLAEDAVQETFLRVIRKRNHYLPTGSFSGWFYTILRNTCIDIQRAHTRQEKMIQEIAGRQDRTKRNNLSEIPEFLACLTPGDRDVLLLRIVHGLRLREVAAALGISEEAAKKRAQRALRRLRVKICNSESSPRKVGEFSISL